MSPKRGQRAFSACGAPKKLGSAMRLALSQGASGRIQMQGLAESADDRRIAHAF